MPQTLDYDSYEIPSGDNNFFKLEEGDNRIRLATKPLEVRYHEVPGAKYSTVPCTGDKCEKCASGDKLKYKYAYIILSRKDKKPYVYETPITVFRQIVSYAKDPDYGNPEEYDLTIKKNGEGRNVQYQVVASPKRIPLSKEELESIGKSGLSLETQYK